MLPTVSDSMQQQISQISADLTANNKQFSASYRNGKYGFEIDGTFYEIGGSTMPTLNYTTPLHNFSAGNLTYTATKECYLVGTILAGSGGAKNSIKINNKEYVGTSSSLTGYYVPPLKLSASDSVNVTSASVDLYVLDIVE